MVRLHDYRSMGLPDYLRIELIFNLLCVCRRIDGASSRTLRRAMFRRGLYYGTMADMVDLGFWIRICQSASLLDERFPPRPTLFVPDWLAFPWEQQFASLIEAWRLMPTSRRRRRLRERLLDLLLASRDLSSSYQRELPGLQALGLYDSYGLTFWGYRFLTGQSLALEAPLTEPWQLVSDELHVPYPPEWQLLWHLESYLVPIDPGIYPLSEESLRLAAQHSLHTKTPSLLQILEAGIQKELPPDLVARWKGQPTVKVFPGFVLEFNSPHELLKLRESPAMRRDISQILSPHHVRVDVWQSGAILRRLQRRGLLADEDLELLNAQTSQPSNDLAKLSKAERAYLLSLMIIADGLGACLAPPPGLLSKLTASLGATLRAAAARKAWTALEEIAPSPKWIPEEEPPPVPEPQLVERLERAIRKQQPIDIFYNKARESHAEYRHLTPLLIEQRGLRFYLIAYCHSRRANRTFRLDRLQLLDGPPQE